MGSTFHSPLKQILGRGTDRPPRVKNLAGKKTLGTFTQVCVVRTETESAARDTTRAQRDDRLRVLQNAVPSVPSVPSV